MDAAFDGPEEDEDDGEGAERRGLLSGHNAPAVDSPQRNMPVPGDYDFERDYVCLSLFSIRDVADNQTQPPSSSPPEYQFPHNASNPAPGNSNGQIPIAPPVRPNQRHFLGGLLPSSFLPRRASATAGGRVLGAGQSGVFGNLAARPGGGEVITQTEEGGDFAPEIESKDAPPVGLLPFTMLILDISSCFERCCTSLLGYYCRSTFFKFAIRTTPQLDKRG